MIPFDVRSAKSCAAKLRVLLDAYEAVLTGQQRVTVRFQERWTEYQKANSEGLLNLYRTYYAQCPEASLHGLPSMSPDMKTRRGPPARNIIGAHY